MAGTLVDEQTEQTLGAEVLWQFVIDTVKYPFSHIRRVAFLIDR